MENITVDPCNVCGSTDVNLVDGFYYCVECGTQDVNVRQAMVIEDKALADGTFTFRKKKKVITVLEKKDEMPGEWHKWHAFNFILVGLADELIAAGAKPSFKMKALWLWTEYIKKFQNKEELGLPNEVNSSNAEDKDKSDKNTGSKIKKMKMTKDVSEMKKCIIFSILYTALNLDGSDIQMSDLIRFVREGRLDFHNYKKFLPKEIDVKLIPGWSTFKYSQLYVNGNNLNAMIYSISFLNCLGIPPRLPCFRKMIDKFVKELCLPNDFKDLVYALLQLCPCDHLEINAEQMKGFVRFPAYECVIMTYILMAFKMCFGLDDDYEVRLSDAVDKINYDNSHLKSYKLGDSEPTDRLFSFREWCNFIHMRNIILSKYYLYMGVKHLREVDDYVYIEQNQKKRYGKSPSLTDEIIMNMLEKLPLVNEAEVIPISKFKATTTPLSTYTMVIAQYLKDPDLKFLLSEDFTQYSLKYAVENLYLRDKDDVKNILLGVNGTKKLITSEICGTLKSIKIDSNTVYVRNCDNKNWYKTNQPKVEHIKIINGNDDVSDKDSDHGYDSNADAVSDAEFNNKESSTIVLKNAAESDKKFMLTLEENENNIYDDEFEDIKEEKEVEETDIKEEIGQDILDVQEPDTVDDDNPLDNDNVDLNNDDNDSALFFDPKTFNRAKVIRELVLATCKKYKIKVPKEYETKEPKKRKAELPKEGAGPKRAKRPRTENPNKTKPTKPSIVKSEINDLIASYYKNLEKDVLFQVSQHVKSVIGNITDLTQAPQNNTEMATGDDHSTIPCDTSIDHAGDGNNPDDVNNETHENIDINDETLDDSSVQVNEQDLDEDENRGDPKFDEKEYDIKQLYVKIEEEEAEDAFDIADDPAISEILDKKIEENAKRKGPLKFPPRKPKIVDFDDDDDIPLSVFREEKRMISEAKKASKACNFQPLVNNSSEVKEFKYWIRRGSRMIKDLCLNEAFHQELFENYPKSFYFVIKECASLIEVTPYDLYRCLVNLELRLLACRL